MKLIVIQAYSDYLPGDAVELPVDAPAKDGEGNYETPPPWSELYLAEPGSIAAQRAVADRQAAEAAAAKASADAAVKAPAVTPPPPAGGKPLTPPATTPPPGGPKEGA